MRQVVSHVDALDTLLPCSLQHLEHFCPSMVYASMPSWRVPASSLFFRILKTVCWSRAVVLRSDSRFSVSIATAILALTLLCLVLSKSLCASAADHQTCSKAPRLCLALALKWLQQHDPLVLMLTSTQGLTDRGKRGAFGDCAGDIGLPDRVLCGGLLRLGVRMSNMLVCSRDEFLSYSPAPPRFVLITHPGSLFNSQIHLPCLPLHGHVQDVQREVARQSHPAHLFILQALLYHWAGAWQRGRLK